MPGLTYIDQVSLTDIDCSTDRLVLRLKSDGDKVGLVFSRHAAIALSEQLQRQIARNMHCGPAGELVKLSPKAKRSAKPRKAAKS